MRASSIETRRKKKIKDPSYELRLRLHHDTERRKIATSEHHQGPNKFTSPYADEKKRVLGQEPVFA